ncbi:MAG TPA: hypothetical protein PKD79_01295 [Candidatus Doudnabacteria bacterium]|nr:hypothetical protein [Candidatus Doudnabacteria bacterium]
MNHITTKKYSLRQHPHYRLLGLSIALVDEDSQSRSFYRQKLEQANLLVKAVAALSELDGLGAGTDLRAVVYSPNIQKLNTELVGLGRFIAANPNLPVITITQTMQEMQLDAIMRLGTRLHINRDLSHPRDLIIALEQVL